MSSAHPVTGEHSEGPSSTSDGTATGSAVVLVDDRLGDVLPAAAMPAVRRASAVYAADGLSAATRSALQLPAAP
ncbi:MAG: hypothetical protein IJH84_11145, partial [Saccharopolyspora sp.]|nr:hypothetical protein [Saccharopolyspora sp.]